MRHFHFFPCAVDAVVVGSFGLVKHSHTFFLPFRHVKSYH